jgi:4-diphosphocytidyl-2-C-methyl-D-erythritol kinase
MFDVSRDQLLPLAAALGSDVALFLYEGAVRLQGRGEVVTPLEIALPPLYGVLVRPASGVPTGPAYAALDALTNRVPSTATERLLQGVPPTAEELATLLHNDFEQAVLPAFPDVRAVHEAVRDAGALRALLCGSGSSVFGLARDTVHALDLTRQLATKFPWVKLVKGAR